MIQTSEVGGRTVYMVDAEPEWRDLCQRNQVVYTTQESALFAQHPQVLDDAFKAFLFEAKLLQPWTLLIGVAP